MEARPMTVREQRMLDYATAAYKAKFITLMEYLETVLKVEKGLL